VVSGGLQTMTNNAYYDLYSNFTPFSNVGKTLTLQYTLKTTQTITCSQNYLAVHSTSNAFLFGPFTCNGASRIDIQFWNNTYAYKMDKTIDPRYILNTAVAYKLVMPPNGSYSVYINNAVVASGSFAGDFKNYNGDRPSGQGLFQFLNLYLTRIWVYQASSIFDDILLTTS
jgi:hypothetical protein